MAASVKMHPPFTLSHRVMSLMHNDGVDASLRMKSGNNINCKFMFATTTIRMITRTKKSDNSVAGQLQQSIPSSRCRRFERGVAANHLSTIALVVEPSDSSASAGENVSDFVNRIEKSWMISQQPRPVSCGSCEASGRVECPWCKGTGFFILGDSILCEVPSRNTSCRICYGQGLVSCDSCKGTGYRAKWLEQPKVHKDSE